MNSMFSMLAAASGEGMVHQLVFVLIIGICLLLVWWLGKYFIGVLGAPAIALTIWSGLFVLLSVLCVINFLLGLIDRSWVKW